ncbi:S8 family serine peptidase [Guptibacillus algicola]|uniref:S8 family serine peptidase n=1 Tax=Guptibacillus algicola TaxID=225844 RepID=UPI001CD742C7|nr:S8 family serine peptidase [Alkalihalobacillus algicola]MCA0988643.1 S8 family serine peptidase [Alkalihalobacillus algicola]
MKFKSLLLAVLLVVSTLFGSMVTASATETNEKATIGSKLQEMMQKQLTGLEVIVTFHGDGGTTSSQLDLLSDLGIAKGLSFKSLPIAGVVATADQINALAQQPEVRSIYFNAELEYDNAESTALTGVDKVRLDDAMRQANGGMPVSGKGVGVVVNDSGVDGTHSDIKFGDHLVQNVLASTNLNALSDLAPVTYVEDVPNTDNNSGHGTHVAGIVGGNGSKSAGKHEGVAPGANLIGYGSGAGLAILDTIGGFDYALTHQAQYNIRVITNSWGATSDAGTAFDPEDPINIATKKLYDRGIVTVFSAGNSGPAESTITGNYKKAPWVITVAAGDKQGKLADFSSRGVKNKGGTVIVDGETFEWVDAPTITTPGKDIISTRVISPTTGLSADKDAEMIEPAYLPYYTTMSGTSMAAPHMAGIVALILDANPTLSPMEVKQIVQDTATNMPGYESWEVGAGYANAYAAVDKAFNTTKEYGQTLNAATTYNANVDMEVKYEPFTIDYSAANDNTHEFEVKEGTTEIVARANAKGLLGETGNTINLVVTAPDGTEYRSGISALFSLYTNRTVQVTAPQPGTWTVELQGLNGLALPESIDGELTFKKATGFSGLYDIAGHPAEEAIKAGVSERLLDSDNKGNYKPDNNLKRMDLAEFLTMGAGVVQTLPVENSLTDVRAKDLAYAEAVTATGAALKDIEQDDAGVMLSDNGKFNPKGTVSRADLAYSLVQSLGLEDEANAVNEPLTVEYQGERIQLTDASDVPAELKGHVQLALDLNILNAYFDVTQGPYDLEPTVTASFAPSKNVTKGDFAVAITRFYATYLMP